VETLSVSMSAIRAYAAVSSIAEPSPCVSRISKHQVANGDPAGMYEATEKQMVEMATTTRPVV